MATTKPTKPAAQKLLAKMKAEPSEAVPGLKPRASATDLKIAFDALQAKALAYSDLFRYYDGDQPVMYTATRLASIFSGIDAHFVANWCRVVVDSVNDRINLKAIQFKDAAAQKAWDRLYAELEVALEAEEAHLAAQVTGEAFIMAWREGLLPAPAVPSEEEGAAPAHVDEDPTDGVDLSGLQLFYQDPRLVHVEYHNDDPRQPRFAAKWWALPDDRRRLTLYYADQVEYYETETAKIQGWKSFKPLAADGSEDGSNVEPNPFGRIPVFHFRTQRRRAISDMADAIPLQNGVNKLLIDMLVASEYGAFPQRWIISAMAGQAPKLKNAPNEIWNLPGGGGEGLGQPTTVGQFSPADLGNYTQAIDKLAETLAAVTHTPKAYVFASGEAPSGEALIVMEAPLVKKAKRRQDRFAPTWKSLAAFVLELVGVQVSESDIVINWEDPRSTQPKTEAEVRKANVDSGVPLAVALKWEGKSQKEIDEVTKAKDEEATKGAATFAQAMLTSQRNFDGGGGQKPAQGAQPPGSGSQPPRPGQPATTPPQTPPPPK